MKDDRKVQGRNKTGPKQNPNGKCDGRTRKQSGRNDLVWKEYQEKPRINDCTNLTQVNR